MALLPSQVLDLVQATQNSWVPGTWVDISLPFQKYYFARLLKGSGAGKMKKRAEKGGPQLEWELRVRNQGTGRNTGMYNIDVLTKVDVLDGGVVDWAFQDSHYLVDTREPKWQGAPEKIIDLTKVNEQGLYNDFFELVEPQMWSAPSSSALDPMTVAGIPFWLQQSDTAAFGFNGGDPTGWTSGAGGLATGTYDNWKNGTFTYATISPDDFVEKIVEAMDLCQFEAPQPFPNTVSEKPDWGLYTVYSVIREARRLLQGSNDNFEDDVAKWMGKTLIRGIPLNHVPALDNSSSDSYVTNRPIYGVNWATLEYFFKTGESLNRQPMQQVGNSHRVMKRYLDNAGNIVCYDRRRNFVGDDSTT